MRWNALSRRANAKQAEVSSRLESKREPSLDGDDWVGQAARAADGVLSSQSEDLGELGDVEFKVGALFSDADNRSIHCCNQHIQPCSIRCMPIGSWMVSLHPWLKICERGREQAQRKRTLWPCYARSPKPTRLTRHKRRSKQLQLLRLYHLLPHLADLQRV